MKTDRIKKAAAGLLSGLLAGFFGSGGGIVVVEGLERSGMEEHEAHATSLAVIFPVCAVSAALYMNGGYIPLAGTLYLGAGAAAGGLIGALFLQRIGTRLLNRLFTLLMLFAGIRLLF